MSLKIGLLGLDNSHAVTFTKLLNDHNNPNHVPGATVTCAYRGGSPDMPVSADRIDKFTTQLTNDFHIPLLDSPRQVAEQSDLLCITSVDGRTHLPLLQQTAPFRRPTFIDKPVATNSAEAKQIFDLAAKHNFPVMSASSLRYYSDIPEILANPDPILHLDIYGPLNILPEPPGLFFYGIHCLEILVTLMGPDVASLQTFTTDKADILNLRYPDHRTASIHMIQSAHYNFGVTLHRAKSVQSINLSAHPRSAYANLLHAILNSLPQGKSPIPQNETLQIISLLEQANAQRQKA